jgi:hypothetical protein
MHSFKNILFFSILGVVIDLKKLQELGKNEHDDEELLLIKM